MENTSLTEGRPSLERVADHVFPREAATLVGVAVGVVIGIGNAMMGLLFPSWLVTLGVRIALAPAPTPVTVPGADDGVTREPCQTSLMCSPASTMHIEAPMARRPARSRQSQSPRASAVVGALLLMASLACGDSTGPEADRLSEQRALWEALGLEDYTYDVRRVCFCAFREGVQVTVVDGVVTRATDIDTGDVLEPHEVQWYLTIDGLFDLLRDAYDRNAHDVQVEFDASRGYPTRIYIDYSEMIADEELGFTLLSEVEPSEG